MVLTVRQIKDLAEYAGFVINSRVSPGVNSSKMDERIHIQEELQFTTEKGHVLIQAAACYEDYPEEWVPLGEAKEEL